MNYNHQEGYSGQSRGYVQDSVYVGKSNNRTKVHANMSQQQQGVDRQDTDVIPTPGLPTGRQFSVEGNKQKYQQIQAPFSSPSPLALDSM